MSYALPTSGREGSTAMAHEYIPYVYVTADDILFMTERLRAHPRFGPLLAELGIHGELEPEAKDSITNFLKEIATNRGISPLHPIDLSVPPALARRIASGMVCNASAAREFASLNMRRFNKQTPPHANEVIFITRALLNDKYMSSVIRRITGRYDPRAKDINIFGEFVHRVSEKHGMLNRTGFDVSIAIIDQIIKGNFKDVDDPKVAEYLEHCSRSPMQLACRLEGLSNV